MTKRTLDGQVALVTGAGRRIGRSVALRLAREGARVMVHYRHSESEAKAVATEIASEGGEAACACADLTHTDQIANLFADRGTALWPSRYLN